MCKADGAPMAKRKAPPRLLLSLDSYSFADEDGKSSSALRHPAPPMSACISTLFFICTSLLGIELFLRYLFTENQHWHPLLEIETNRMILARHLGVDALSCFVVAGLGWACRHEWQTVLNRKNPPPAAGWESRLFTFMPTAHRLAVFFFSYQVKNLIDTIMWNDGPEFIFHHCFSLITAWGAMYPGAGHMYSVFFFGISEISTAILCILANFDDIHGVPGLGESLPMTKVVLGGLFVVAFIACRCILWPITSYYFCRDMRYALKSNDPRAVHRYGWMKFFIVSLAGLSILQVAWLGQIFVLGHGELVKAGLLTE